MDKPNMKCRVCGKQYFCCSDRKKLGSILSVSCSIECFNEYIRRVNEARNSNENSTENLEIQTDEKPKKNVRKIKNND